MGGAMSEEYLKRLSELGEMMEDSAKSGVVYARAFLAASIASAITAFFVRIETLRQKENLKKEVAAEIFGAFMDTLSLIFGREYVDRAFTVATDSLREMKEALKEGEDDPSVR
jgi:SNF family Na+-dependent transporter